jgi:hypothetical protein
MARQNGEPRRGDRFQSGARSREFKLTPSDHFEIKGLVLSASRSPVASEEQAPGNHNAWLTLGDA